MKKIILIILVFVSLLISINENVYGVFASQLDEGINEQLENINLSELEEYFNNVTSDNKDFFTYISSLLKGEYNVKYDTIVNYLFGSVFSYVSKLAPTFISVIAISIFCGVIKHSRGSFLSDDIGDLIVFIGLLSIILLLSNKIFSIWYESKNTIENIAKLSEIMSPIILTLMIGSGGSVSASVYKPAVAFLSGGVINIMSNLILPLIGLIIIFSVISNFSGALSLNKFIDSVTSIMKWIFGIVITVFGFYISVQGLTSAVFDGVSIKATKYAISNSVPIIGGFLSGGFDVLIAGSVLIKNAVGITVLVALFFTVLSPVLHIFVFSTFLKIVAAFIEPISDSKISGFCVSISKCVTYLTVAILLVGFMLFITVLLLMISASAFI